MTTNIQPLPAAEATGPTPQQGTATKTEPTSTPASTRATMVKLEARGFTPVRHWFVQKHSTLSPGDRKGILADLVTNKRSRELNAYLALLMNYNQIVKHADQPWPAAVWARALSSSETDPLPVASISRIWSNLNEHGLIDRSRVWKRALVIPRDESTKKVYTRPRPDLVPDAQKPYESYFILPSAFWTERWHAELSLPGRALLLIWLHETSARDDSYLPYAKAEGWYGISAKTAERGIAELIDNKLLVHTRKERVVADFSATGWADHHYYALTGPFSKAAREQLQTQTKTESEARASTDV